MKRIFICSPFKTENLSKHFAYIEYAKQLCRFAFDQRHAPFAPHLLYPQILTRLQFPQRPSDSNEIERSQGMRAALTFMATCQEFWYGSGFGISEGMKQEIQFARYGIGIPVREVVRLAGKFVFAEENKE